VEIDQLFIKDKLNYGTLKLTHMSLGEHSRLFNKRARS